MKVCENSAVGVRLTWRFPEDVCRLMGTLILISLVNLGIGAEYRVVHCPYGCPSSDREDNKLMFRQTYALSYNRSNLSPVWAAYHMVAEGVGIATGLPREIIVEEVPGTTLTANEFEILEQQGSVRVQLAPLVNFAATPYWSSSNYATNSVVMPSPLASGAWAGLEWASRNLVARQGEVYIIAGPIFEESKNYRHTQPESEHVSPEGFFKVVYTTSGEASYFLFEATLPVHVHHCERRATLEQIQEASRLTLMPRAINLAFETMDEKLGCN